MKSIIVLYLLAVTTMNTIVNAHENHRQQIYNWSNSKNKTIKTDSIFNGEKLEVIKNKTKTNNKRSRLKIFKR